MKELNGKETAHLLFIAEYLQKHGSVDGMVCSRIVCLPEQPGGTCATKGH